MVEKNQIQQQRCARKLKSGIPGDDNLWHTGDRDDAAQLAEELIKDLNYSYSQGKKGKGTRKGKYVLLIDVMSLITSPQADIYKLQTLVDDDIT